MNVRHLRAKYQIEQYPVVFAFPEQVLYEPTVRVEVVSGVDPNPAAFAGLPFVDGNLVAVLVAGGVPGVIYRIICAVELSGEIVELSGVIAVKDTQATTPEGTSALPFTLTVTTPPYPAYVLDSIDVPASARPGAIVVWPVDDLNVSSNALAGVLRELIKFYSIAPDDLDVVSETLNGVLRLLIVSYTTPPEELTVSSVSLNGTFKLIVLEYLNYAPEELNVTSTSLNGTHGPA